MNEIKFWSHQEYNNVDTQPVSSKKAIPKWFLKASKYWKGLDGGPIVVNYETNEMSPSFKKCPALVDAFTSGYIFLTPCDVEIFEKDGEQNIRAEEGFEKFCNKPEIPPKDFYVPKHYTEGSYHWFPNWGFILPKGYSALVVHPMNHYDLPFLTINGIMDSDVYDLPGYQPFFVRKDFTGIIPKGTPYMQVIPFKRENWKSSFEYLTEKEMSDRYDDHEKRYRAAFGGVYRRETWSDKKYD
jgi:hypothetical protein